MEQFLKMSLTAASAVFLAGCILPSAARELTPREAEVVASYRQVFQERREPTPCERLDGIRIVPISREEVHQECHNDEAVACVYSINATPFSSLSTLVYIDAALPQNVFEYALAHEVGHEMRGCWVLQSPNDEYLERYRNGVCSDPELYYPKDPNHCDTVLFNSYVTESLRRIE